MVICIRSYKPEIAFTSKGGKGDLDVLKNQKGVLERGDGGGWRGEGGREREGAKHSDEEFYI